MMEIRPVRSADAAQIGKIPPARAAGLALHLIDSAGIICDPCEIGTAILPDRVAGQEPIGRTLPVRVADQELRQIAATVAESISGYPSRWPVLQVQQVAVGLTHIVASREDHGGGELRLHDG